MLRKTTFIALLAITTTSLSGCSSMWSGIGSFSEYMAEKTAWGSTPALRGTKTVETTDSKDSVTYQAAISDDTTDYGVEMYDTTSSDVSYSDTYSSDTYTSDTLTTSSDAPLFDADGNYIDTSPIPCPEDTYLTADNTCMFLEQEDYASEFTQ